ncbi:MAG: HsdR family type I site-specific deoxyribonuclease [Bacteroidales bacterium]|nr:HsdR family type I site-specific deoxyribonuclease [Bacteroidales bacterium]
MNQTHFDSEPKFEAALIAKLQTRGWEKEVLRYPTEQDLIRNWANILFENNRHRDRLGDYPLTEGEMQQIIDRINGLHNPLALNGFINGGTTSIKRDNEDDREHFGKEVTLKIYDPQEIAAGQSRYQIVQQPQFPTASPLLNNRRGDLMLLINGMPVVHIELKKSGIDVSQASNQIEKYSKEGIFSQGLFSLVQIFVAMTPEDTLYFANPGPEGKFNSDFFFRWADFYNNPTKEWNKIVDNLLSIPMAHQMIGFYTVPDSRDGILKVMRSYQYYAASRINDAVTTKHWDDTQQRGGYVWHTTGSGKTMTSFKSAQLISQSRNADKVVFLMDRIELGTQSVDEYRGFAADNEEVQDTANTDILVNKLEAPSDAMKLIVTSIQKMALVYDHKRGEEGGYDSKRLDKIRSKRIVFIIDECHRSTFGDMLLTIKRTFPNALFFGFTGTPIKSPNAIKMTETSDIFGDVLHTYTIADGIRDKNVLGFDPYMVSTYKEADMRRIVAMEKCKVNDINDIWESQERVLTYNHYILDVPMASYIDEAGNYVKGIEDYIGNSIYQTDSHRRAVVSDIKENFSTLSHGGKFHAIFATSSIPEAIEYYRLLKDEMPELKITAIFDPSIDNNGGATVKEDGLVEILSDYNNMFDVKFSIPTWQAFKKDVSKRMSHKKPYNRITPDQQLDIMIVVDQMLTGFDSKWVNTLYMDKILTYENLIQGFSRTNRIFGPDKPFGIIRYYRKVNTMKQNIENAVELYADGNPLELFVQKLEHNLNGMNSHFAEIEFMFNHAGIENFASLPEDRSVRQLFAKEWRILNAHLEAAKLQGFVWKRKRYFFEPDEHTPRRRSVTLKFDEHIYDTLAQRYRELFLERGTGTGGDDDIPYEIDTYLVEQATGKIDADYMNSRFERYITALYNQEEEEILAPLRDELHRSFATLSSEDQKFAALFLHDVQCGDVEPDRDKTLMDYIVKYREEAKNDQLHRFAGSIGIDEEMLRNLVSQHLTEDDINRGGKLDALMQTLDRQQAKAFIEHIEDHPVPPPMVGIRATKYVRAFILEGGFDIDQIPEFND